MVEWMAQKEGMRDCEGKIKDRKEKGEAKFFDLLFETKIKQAIVVTTEYFKQYVSITLFSHCY